jgi:arginine N-succinyltransferase
MPKTPIYTAMLPPEALAVMRRPHPSGEAAMRMLEREGFASEGYIDIFDGGPTMSAKTDEIRTIEEALDFTLSDLSEEQGGEKMLVAAGGLGDFAAAFVHVRAGTDGAVTLHAADAALLGLKPGDSFLAIGR